MKQDYINVFDLGTDPSQAFNFFRRVVYTGEYKEHPDAEIMPTSVSGVLSATGALAVVTLTVRNQKVEQLKLTPKQMSEFDRHRDANREVKGRPVPGVLPGLAFKARPLNGIWAQRRICTMELSRIFMRFCSL